MLYPLKLQSPLKDYIWGGTRLKTDFGFKSDLDILAEGWMLSCHKDGMNTIDGGEFDGQTLEEVIEKEGKEKLVGTRSSETVSASLAGGSRQLLSQKRVGPGRFSPAKL